MSDFSVVILYLPSVWTNGMLCLAKISSALKMARFALCLGLNREPGLGQELL